MVTLRELRSLAPKEEEVDELDELEAARANVWPGRSEAAWREFQQREVRCGPHGGAELGMRPNFRHISQPVQYSGEMPDNLEVGSGDDAVRSREHQTLGQHDAATSAV